VRRRRRPYPFTFSIPSVTRLAWGAPLESIQITAFMIGGPSVPTGTVPDH